MLIDFVTRLFDTSDFPPRWKCGSWTEAHGWLHILSDLGVWSAYVAIPCVLMYFAWRKRDLPFRGIFWLFGAFILACGTTHLMEALIFWWPVYRLAGVIKLLTALVSWATVLALIPITPRALALRTPQDLDREVSERRRAEQELRQMQAELESRVAGRTSELSAANVALQSEITAREQFEHALASAREWFEVTLASIGEAVIVADTEGRVTFLNQVARNLTGHHNDVRGHPAERVFQTVDERTGEAVESPVQRVLQGGQSAQTSNRIALISVGGPRRPIEETAAPICNLQGQMLGVVLVFRDITERHRAEAALRRSEERYRALVQATSDIVWTTDPQGQVSEDSPSWRAFTGQTYDEFKGAGWLNALHPDDRRRSADDWRNAVELRSIYQTEYRLRTAAGHYRHTEARGVPVLDSEALVIEWVGKNSDVTEQRQAAETLREADRRKDHFLAILGHELRNPLAGISAAIQVLEHIGAPTPEAVEMRQIISRQTRHMSRMIDDLLEVSRISQGKIQLRPEPLNLAELLHETVRDLHGVFEDAQLELIMDIAERPVTVQADSTRLAQVFVNLLRNAVKFTNPHGRVTLCLKCDSDSREAIVTVSDTGIGMSPETVSQVFKPFSQADSSLERSHGGLGLGLALVKGLVELHGGQINAASAGLGAGSQFTVRLRQSESPVSATSADGAAGASTALRIVIIDDQRDASYPMRRLLELDGHEVAVATEGSAGVELARQKRPHVVLCDIGLPGGMNGYDVARALRCDERTGKCLLVAVSGYGHDEARRLAAEAGFDQHLTKPVGQNELRSLLQQRSFSSDQ